MKKESRVIRVPISLVPLVEELKRIAKDQSDLAAAEAAKSVTDKLQQLLSQS